MDDQALSLGSANANPRCFFVDTELNVMPDDAKIVKNFRHRLWSHDLGVNPKRVAAWAVPDFMAQWDAVAKANEDLKKTPDQMAGRRRHSFRPQDREGQKEPENPGCLDRGMSNLVARCQCRGSAFSSRVGGASMASKSCQRPCTRAKTLLSGT